MSLCYDAANFPDPACMRLWHETDTWQHRRARERLAALAPEAVERVAIIKHAAFGDLLLLRPFLVLLRRHFPSARITLSVISHYQRGIPEDLVDRIHVVPGSKERQGWLATYRAYRKLGPQDLLFDLTASTRSFIISRLTPARFKIGYQYRSVHKWVYHMAIPRSAFRFEAETFLEQLHPFGIRYDLPLEFAMPVEATSTGTPAIVYFPTASTPAKSWPVEHFTRLIRMASERWPDHRHIILSGLADWEQAQARDIHNGTGKPDNVVLLPAGENDAALIKGACLLVANDTGIRHLGIAVGTPTVCIFFSAPPFRYWPRWGNHQIAFRPDGKPPEPEAVAAAMDRALL